MALRDDDTRLRPERDPWATDDPFGLSGGATTAAPTPVAPPTNPWLDAPAGDTAPGPGTPTTPAAPTTPTPPPATDFTSVLGPQAAAGGGSDPWGTSPSPIGAGPMTMPDQGPVNTYQSFMDQIRQASDPASAAAARDGLARQLQADLEADGHTITWKGDTMMIDGRPYELGADAATGGHQPLPNDAHMAMSPTDSVSTAATGASGIDWSLPFAHIDGFDDAKMSDPNKSDPKYDAAARVYSQSVAALGNPVRGNLQPHVDFAKAHGFPNAQASGDDKIDYGDGNGPIDAIRAGSDAPWFQNGADRFGGGAGAGAGAGGPGAAGAGGAGLRSGMGGNYFSDLMGSLPDWMQNWKPSGPGYQPGSIDASASDLPGFNEIYDLANQATATDGSEDALVKSILEHPESLSDRDVEMLKARNAEEAAAAGQAQDEELQHFGANSNIGDSPWLADQRASNAWNRRNATIAGNRNVDIAAAQTRASDRATAANLGTAYNSYKANKQHAAVNLAVEGALGKAGEQRSRTQLNESFKQAAAQLGLSKDQLTLSYIQANLGFLTQNKNIDTNFSIDASKLAEQSEEFKQTLLQRIAELKQNDDQFRANYGLAAQEFQRNKDNDAWAHAKETYGAGAGG